MDNLGVIIVIAMAMGFNYTNGFHDAANAIATSVSTRALTPRVGARHGRVHEPDRRRSSGRRSRRRSERDRRPADGTESLVVVFAALTGAIAWNLITWWYGLPSSSSYALIGGLVGATLGLQRPAVEWSGVWRQGPRPDGDLTDRRLRDRLRVHARDPVGLPKGPPGPCDPRLPAGADVVRGGDGLRSRTPGCGQDHRASWCWRSWSAATRTPTRSRCGFLPVGRSGLSAGTYAGGWRIMRTLGRRIIHVDASAGIRCRRRGGRRCSYITSVGYGVPISTTRPHHLGDHGRRRHEAVVRRPLGGHRRHRHRLGGRPSPGAGLIAAVVFPRAASRSSPEQPRPDRSSGISRSGR